MIEWSLSSPQSSGIAKGVKKNTKNDKIQWDGKTEKGITFDLYIVKDCNPKNSRCFTQYYASGQSPYISIPSPISGSVYYVMVYAKNGSGSFNLKANSYKCVSDSQKNQINTESVRYARLPENLKGAMEVPFPIAGFTSG
jgi:hypothetical protein